MFEWLYNLWYNVNINDIPSDWLEALSNGNSNDVCVGNAVNNFVAFNVTREFTDEIERSIADSIVAQTLQTEIPKWETALRTIINRRFINIATKLCSNVKGSVKYKLSYTKPTIMQLIKQRDDITNKVSIDSKQIISLTRVCNLTKLDRRSIQSVYKLWINAFVSYANMTLTSNVDEQEKSFIQSIVASSIETLLDNWCNRLKLNPKRLTRTTSNLKKSNDVTYEIEITKSINSKRMEEIRQLLIQKLKDGKS